MQRATATVASRTSDVSPAAPKKHLAAGPTQGTAAAVNFLQAPLSREINGTNSRN